MSRLLAASAALSGCVTMTPRVQHIQVQKQDSALLKDCTKLGRVDAKASGWGQLTYENMNEQAANNLREATAAQYATADTVVILNVDTHTNSADATGVAYKCY
jgi:hypothetical protein